ncbi:MAG TPA: RNA methyltransferase [Parvularculaceae bacterium]|nr:RNA methyltransferase [Parvularculaceae bacterium]
MRGYFGVGSERISKQMNLGAVMRTAHAFGASFIFTLGSRLKAREAGLSDTSNSAEHVPLYEWATIDEMALPKACVLVGVELDERAVELPTFPHPLNAAYLLGPEKGDLSDAAKARCAHIVKIPTRFCVNLSVAAAIVMYDRMLALGGYERRLSAAGLRRLPK